MKDVRLEAFDFSTRISFVMVDCLSAATQLARNHLMGRTASRYLAQAAAGVSLLGVETSRPEETLTFRLDVPGPLQGFLLEATALGTIRGYTTKKILNDFDDEAMGLPSDRAILGDTATLEVIRSVPGEILSSGATALRFENDDTSFVAQALNAYFTESLQRRIVCQVESAVGVDAAPTLARGFMAECSPDGNVAAFEELAARVKDVALDAPTLDFATLLANLGFAKAAIRKTTPLSFACRCSASRAQALLAALPPEERKSLPPTLDITCHMCGKTWVIPTNSQS